MSFNVIDKSMVVKNTIELQPVHTYVSASNECNDFLSLGIEGAGITGELPARINNINGFTPGTNTFSSKRIFNVDDNYVNPVNESISSLNVIKGMDESEYSASLIEKGLYEDKIGDYKFGVEKVENRYLIDDSGEYKKKSIKNLYKFYRENIQYRVLNPQWGFSNYNCMKFFNVEDDKTHKNCIIYPNLYHDSKHVYETFKDNDNLTISFYINQNTKNKSGYSFNPGCILYLPGIIGIYIVKGSSVDNFGLTDAYRLYIEFGHKTYSNFSSVNRVWLNQSITNTQSQITNRTSEPGNYTTDGQYLSEDNIIKFNNWHNVTLKIEKIISDIPGVNKNVTLDFSLFIDGVSIDNKSFNNDTFNYDNAYNFKEINSFICVGNRPSNFTADTGVNPDTNTDDMFVKLFSTADEVDEDSVGPYVNKNISFGSNFDENINALIHTSTNQELEFNNFLKLANDPNYVDTNSLALSAELHDIRIYKENINNIKSKICDKNINNFNDDKLIFSVPVYYYDVDIKKKSIINLMGISNSLDQNGSVGDISTAHTLIEGPVNPYFSNKCLGHEVIVEKFLYEFVNKTSPNVIWGGDTLSDSTLYNSYNLISTDKNLYTVNDSNLELIKKGISPNKIVNKSLKSIKNDTNFNTIYQDNYANANIQYKNNFIMPCDNGLQLQSFNNLNGYYQNEYSGIGHKDSFNNNDFQLISLNEVYTNKIVYFPETSIITETCNGSLFNSTEHLDLDERQDYIIENENKFKESYDLLKNVSLNNYFNSSFNLNLISNNSDNRLRSISNGTNSYFQLGRNQFLKNASNHAMRVINDDHTVSIASHLLPIDEKIIDRDENTPDRIGYFRYELPLFNTSGLYCEHFTKALCISTEIFGKKLRRGSIELFDSDLGGTLGNIKIKLKDNEKGVMYRADALTEHAKWNYVGHCLYKEGIITILHPSLHNFAENNFKLNFRSSFSINTLELNLPAYEGMINKSSNTSYIENLKLNNSSFNFDDDFVYITDINLHDENLNIVAKAKLANPYAKKSLDSVLFRIKMDF